MEYLKCLKEALRTGVSLETFNNFWEMEVTNARINAELKLRESSQSGSDETNFRNEGKFLGYLNDRFNQIQQQVLEQRDLLLTMFTAIQSINQKMDTSKIFNIQSKEKTIHQNIGDRLTCTDLEQSIKQTTLTFQPQADYSEKEPDRTLHNSGLILEGEKKDVEISFPSTTWQQGEICSNHIEHVKHWIADGGVQRHRIVHDGVQQYRLVDDGIQPHGIVDDGIQQHGIVDGVIQRHGMVDDVVQRHRIVKSGMKQEDQKIIMNKPPPHQDITDQDTTDQDTTDDKATFKCRRKMLTATKPQDLQDQNTSDQDTTQSYQPTVTKISEEQNDQEVTVSSTRATGMYAEAISQQIIMARSRNNVPPKYVPRSGAFFEVVDVMKCVTENIKLYTDCYLTEPASCRVRLMFSFDECRRLVVTLLVSGSPGDDSVWPVYISGEGKIFNSKFKRYTYLWRMEAQRLDDPGDNIEVPFEVKTCLETLKGSLHDVTYEQLLERNYEKSNKLNINWKLEAKNWTESSKGCV